MLVIVGGLIIFIGVLTGFAMAAGGGHGIVLELISLLPRTYRSTRSQKRVEWSGCSRWQSSWTKT